MTIVLSNITLSWLIPALRILRVGEMKLGTARTSRVQRGKKRPANCLCFHTVHRCLFPLPCLSAWGSAWLAWSLLGGWVLAGTGLATLQLAANLEWIHPARQSGRQAGGPPWQRTQCKTVLSQFSPQTHHPEKPLFPTTGSPREHYS